MTNSLPPSPSLPGLLQALLFVRMPFTFTTMCQRRYGDIFMLNLKIPGLEPPGPVIHLADPAAIQDLFARDGKQGHAGMANVLLEPVTGRGSILRLDGERHLRERRLLSPGFHGNAIKKLEPIVRHATQCELETWRDDGVLPVRPAMQRITFEVIVQAVLGIDDRGERDLLLAAFEPVFNIPLAMLAPPLRFDVGWTPWGRLRRALTQLDEKLFDLIAQRRKEPPREDILGLLLASTDEDGHPLGDRHIRDELVTLLLAGHETTATALAWALERLAHHPEVIARARDELAIGSTGYLDAVAAETLRVRPIVIDVGRRLSEDVEVAGYRLPAGATVRSSIHLVQSDGRNYSEPGAFRPDRFDAEPPSRETWLPFGGGRRRCLGAALAQMEMRVVLATLLGEFLPEPSASRPERPRLRGITFVPEKEGRIRMRRAPLGQGLGGSSHSSYPTQGERSAPVES